MVLGTLLTVVVTKQNWSRPYQKVLYFYLLLEETQIKDDQNLK